MNRINLICLGVKDLKRSREFYKAIGFEEPNSEHSDIIVFLIMLAHGWSYSHILNC